jgi:hypothetical protein
MLGILALVLLVAACAPPPDLRDKNLLADDSLIIGAPEVTSTEAVSPDATAEATADADSTACFAPCWHGITPGQTRWADALATIQDDPTFEKIETKQDENSKTIGAVWQPKGGTQCCQMVAEDGETVNLIFIRTRPDHTVGEVIAAQGEPAYAVGTPFSDDQAIINLVYPNMPMLVFVFAAGEQKGELSASSEVIGALYTTPKDMDLFLKTNNLHNWQGYGPYSTYKNGEGVEYDITPSVTLTPTAAQ